MKVSLFTVIVSILASQTGCKNLFPPAEPPGPPWVVFTTRNSPLAGDKVNAIAEDAEGNIWFGTDSGASAFTGKSWMSVRDQLTFLVYDNNSVAHPTKTVTSIVLDKKRNVWFGLLGGGAERYNPVGSGAVWTRYLITDGYVYGIAANLYDPGDVFFATSWGISRFTPSSTDPTIGEWGSITTDDIPELATNRMSFTVANANDNTVWFGTQKGTVIRTWYDIDLRWGDRTPPENTAPITAVAFDGKNNPWIATTQGAWYQDFKHDTWIEYNASTTHGAMPRSPVNALAADRKRGRMWFGTAGGLAALEGAAWKVFTRSDGQLPGDTVQSLYLDRRGNLWIGTTRGLAVYNEDGTQF